MAVICEADQAVKLKKVLDNKEKIKKLMEENQLLLAEITPKVEQIIRYNGEYRSIVVDNPQGQWIPQVNHGITKNTKTTIKDKSFYGLRDG